MATDLVFNMIANSSQFTAGMKQAQKAADSLFLATATGAEKYAVELDNLQRIAHLTNLDPKVFGRAHETLVKKYDPFGVQAEERARLASIQRVADFRERLAERSGRALIREAQQEAQQEARIASIAQAGGIGGNRAMIIRQLAFAAEDAATQFGTRGFAGALMAAGNNLTFAASMAHPAVGVFTSLALTGTMVYQIYSKWAEETKRVAEENNRLEKALTRVKSGFQDYIEFRNDLRSQSAFPEAVRADQKYIDEAESNNRQLAVLAAKRTQIMRDANAQGEAYSSSLYKRLNPFEMVAEADRRLQAQKQMNDLIAEESRLKIQALTIQSRGEQVRVAELAKDKEKKDRDERSAQAEAWLDESARIADAEDKMAIRQEMIEAKRKRIIEEKRTNNSRLLSGAMDIRSAEAFGVMANAQSRSMLPGMGGASQQTPKATDVDREILKNAAKGAAVLEKLLHEFGRKPSIPVVGLN